MPQLKQHPHRIHCTVICYFNSTCSTGLLADPAADTACFALFLRRCTFALIGAFDHDIIRAFMNMNDLLRTDFGTFLAGNAFGFVDFCHSVFIEGNRAEFTCIDTGSTADTAFTASCFPP